ALLALRPRPLCALLTLGPLLPRVTTPLLPGLGSAFLPALRPPVLAPVATRFPTSLAAFGATVLATVTTSFTTVPADFPANLATIAPVPAPMAVAVPRPAAVPAVVVVHEREADDRNADARGIGGPVDDLAADRPGEIPGVDPAAVAVPFDVTPAVAGRAAVHRHRDAARNCGDDAVVRACADTQIQVHGDLSHLLRLRHARH